MKLILLSAAVVAAAAGCAKEGAETPAAASHVGGEAAPAVEASGGPAPAATSSNLGETWDEKLSGKVGETITVEGEFMLNDPQSNCAFASTTASSPPKTASDWLIRKDGRCMWVSRGPDPGALNRIFGAPEEIIDKDNIGRKADVSAVVAADETGRIYLEFAEGRAID